MSAALTPIDAVSASRISPTRMMFGSWRRNDRSARGERQADAVAHLHLVDARQVELDRVLGGHDVHAGLVELRERRVERVGLAAAGRAGDEHHAPRLANRAHRTSRAPSASNPSCVMSSRSALGVEQPEHDLFAEERRQHRDTEVDVAAACRGRSKRALMRPSCGSRFSAMSSRAMIFTRETIASRILERRRHHRLQHAVDAEPDPHLLFVRLDVDVARALLNRRQHQRVDEPDDRRFAALPLERGGVDFFGASATTSMVVVLPSGPGPRAPRLTMSAAFGLPLAAGVAPCLREVLRDRVANRGVGGDDRLDVQARHELDVVHREDVGRIRHRERQRRARSADRNDVVLGGGLGRNQPDDGRVEIEFA